MIRARCLRGSQILSVALLLSAIALVTVAGLLAQEPGSVVATDKRVQGRSYVFPETGETVPYALFVPSNYDVTKKWPLVVGLHGSGRPYDWLMGYDGMIDCAQRDGFIIVTPLGYHPYGGYGRPTAERLQATPPPSPEFVQLLQGLPATTPARSEQDVMNVLGIVRGEFNVDADRIYLFGHSMGGGGAYHLAAKFPDIWAGLALAAPSGSPPLTQLERFRHVPILVLQGDADQSVPPTVTRGSVARMRQVGMDCLYVEIKGGDHSLFIAKDRDTLSKVFSFFNIVQKNQRPGTK